MTRTVAEYVALVAAIVGEPDWIIDRANRNAYRDLMQDIEHDGLNVEEVVSAAILEILRRPGGLPHVHELPQEEI